MVGGEQLGVLKKDLNHEIGPFWGAGFGFCFLSWALEFISVEIGLSIWAFFQQRKNELFC